MAFIVKKEIHGREYYYLNENKRVDGKVKTKTIAYLGKNKKDAKKKSEEIIKNMGGGEKDKKPWKIPEKAEIKMTKKEPPTTESSGKETKEFSSFVQEGGFIWGPEPEIYGGLAGFYTYGPIGKLLKNKVE